MIAMLADEQKRYGDTAPLSSADPAPAELIPPKGSRKKYRGGLAPAESGRTRAPARPGKSKRKARPGH